MTELVTWEKMLRKFLRALNSLVFMRSAGAHEEPKSGLLLCKICQSLGFVLTLAASHAVLHGATLTEEQLRSFAAAGWQPPRELPEILELRNQLGAVKHRTVIERSAKTPRFSESKGITSFICRDRKTQKAKIAEIEKEIRQKRSEQWKRWVEPKLSITSLHVGAIGTLLGKQTVIRSSDNRQVRVLPAQTAIFDVLEVSGPGSALVRSNETTVRLKGLPTTGLTTDARFGVPWPVIVTGTEDYITVQGAKRTVFVLEAIDDQSFEELERIKEEVWFEKYRRQWSDTSGKFSIQAALIEFDGKAAMLQKQDGTTVSVELEKLSEPDQDYVQESLGVGMQIDSPSAGR